MDTQDGLPQVQKDAYEAAKSKLRTIVHPRGFQGLLEETKRMREITLIENPYLNKFIEDAAKSLSRDSVEKFNLLFASYFLYTQLIRAGAQSNNLESEVGGRLR